MGHRRASKPRAARQGRGQSNPWGGGLFLFEAGPDQSRFLFESGLTGRVDKENGVIRGVALLTAGIKAKGHDLHIDEQTLEQVFECAVRRGQVPVKLDHKTGIENVCGYLTNFRKDGAKLLGDWFLLKSHREYETTLEKADRMPGCFGMSAAFVGKEAVGRNGLKCARCEDLVSVDCVTQPAANPNGLFSVDTGDEGMAKDKTSGEPKEQAGKEPTLADVMAAVTGLTQRLDTMQESIEAHGQFIDSIIEGQEGDEPEAEEGDGGDVEAAGAQGAKGAAASATAGGELSAGERAERKVDRLIESIGEATELQEAEEEHAQIETALSAVDKRITELEAENTALKEASKGGTTAAGISPGVGGPIKVEGRPLFFHEKQDGEFEKSVVTLLEEKTGGNRAKAFELAQRDNPGAYKDYLRRIGVL